MHWWYGSYGWLGMIIGTVFTLAILVGLALLVIWAVRRSGGLTGINSPSGNTDQSSAKEILKTRYARGEITREEYLQMLEEIERT